MTLVRTCLIAAIAIGCTHARAKQQPADPAMRDHPDPFADQQREAIDETKEAATFPSAGSGATAGWITK